MGCNGSKASSPKAAAAPAPATLLDASTEPQKGVVAELQSFSMFIDAVGVSGCFAPADDVTMLQVSSVKGGPVGLWNNRGHTEKVRVGDFVMKVRKAGPSESVWVAGDAKQMMDVITKDGPSEVEIKRAQREEPKAEALPVKEEMQTEAQSEALAVAPVEAPVEATVEQSPSASAGAEEPLEQAEAAVEVVEAESKGQCTICSF
jgi:hypothetical protein